MSITTIDGWTLTEIDTVCGFKNDHNLFELDEVQNFTMNMTEEIKEITGKTGTVLNTTKSNKAVKGSGTNGLLSGGLMAVQTGSGETTEGIVILHKESIIITAAMATANAITLAGTPYGTVGAEVPELFIKKADGSTAQKLTQATAAGTGTYSVNGKAVEFSTGVLAEGDEVYGWYSVKLADNVAARMTNDGDKYSGEAELYVSGLAKNGCGVEAEFQIYIPRADFVGNWDLEVGDNQTTHKFEFTSLKNKCSTISKFWDFTIFDKADVA